MLNCFTSIKSDITLNNLFHKTELQTNIHHNYAVKEKQIEREEGFHTILNFRIRLNTFSLNLFLHAMSPKVQIIVSIVRIIGSIRLEYNNGRIHDDKSISQ
jgi:DNA gyrase/topoisomerase IV subunit A